MSSAPADGVFSARQRLAFGAIAELYDRVRPPYPAPAIDAVLEHGRLTARDTVLEVGAGTGTATRQLAGRGLGVLALEPSAEMAAVGTRTCAGYAAVEFVGCDLESFTPPRRFPALVSANAWHWVDARVRYPLAAGALAPGGTLACLWTLPDWGRCRLRDQLRTVYASVAPELAPRFPMHPGSPPGDLAGDWSTEIEAAAELFGDPRIECYDWSIDRSAGEYVQLLSTHQDHILLPPATRDPLMAAIAATIDAGGGTLTLPTTTRVCLARRR